MEKTPQAKRGGIHKLNHHLTKYFSIAEFLRSVSWNGNKNRQESWVKA